MRGRPVCVILIIVAFVTLAIVLWAVAAATTWADFGSGRGLTVEAVGAGTATLLAWYSWQSWRQARRDQERKRADEERQRADEERQLLIRTLAGAVPGSRRVVRPLRPTRPLPVPRAL